jgi:phage shock protein C
MKRLFRSRKSKVIAGVCGGIAEYFDVDPVLIRIAAVLFFFIGFPAALIAYIIGIIIIPCQPWNEYCQGGGSPIEMPNTQAASQAPPIQPHHPASQFTQGQGTGNSANLIVGIILIVLGASFLLNRLNSLWSFWWIWNMGWHYFAPSVLIIIGLLILLRLRK